MTTPDTPDDQGTSTEVEGTVEGQQEYQGASEPTQAPNAPWAEHLEKFPTSLRPIAEDIFREWDGNVTKRFQDLHSQYDPYKPVIEAYAPEAVQQAIAIVQAIENDPRTFYDNLATAYNFGGPVGEQGAANPVETTPPVNAEGVEYDLSDPLQARLAQQEELLRALADKIIGADEAQAQAAREAEENAALERTMTELKAQHGEFDEQYVYGLIGAGFEPADAVKQFHSVVNGWAAKQNAPSAAAPRVMSASGGLPSNRVDPATLGSRETKNLVAEYLRTAQGG